MADPRLAALEAQLAAARAALTSLEGALNPAPEISPFAPAAFPDMPPVGGVRLAAVEAGVRYSGRLDVMLAEIAAGASVAGVFTRSATAAAPVLWCQERLAQTEPSGAHARASPWALIVNAGNANAFTGDNGVSSVAAVADAAHAALGVRRDHVLMASTGVIGEPLDPERIIQKLGALQEGLSSDAWASAAQAIMTTDTFPKAASTRIEIGGRPVTIAGIAKGSGMIAPDMATMLSFVFTDAAVDQALLQRCLSEIADRTFNAITVDGDTSTSDTVLLAATGASGAPRIDGPSAAGYQSFRRGLTRVMKDLALQIVKDGEGVTKFVEIEVTGAKSRRSARQIGLAIGNSPLVKTAFAGEDPNWGRVVMAVGKAGEPADRDALSIWFGPHLVADKGWRAPDYDEATVAAYMKQPELKLRVDVGVGAGNATTWTCDLTHRYISINADYRS